MNLLNVPKEIGKANNFSFTIFLISKRSRLLLELSWQRVREITSIAASVLS